MSALSKARALASTAMLLSLAWGAAAIAQDATPADGAPVEREKIVITAQKREATLQETPVAVSAVTGETIEQAQIRDPIDLQTLVPSLRVSQFAASTNTEFNIRGIGTSSFNPGLEPSVGVFVDGVYLPRSGAAINDFLSLERVEVVRGPQAVLYGRNTPGGVVSFITKKPEYEWGFDGEATYGNFDQRILKGSATGPIVSDQLAVRLDGVWNQRDGFLTNVVDGSKVNDRDRYNVRGQALWEPSADVSLRLIAGYGNIDERCCAAPFTFYDPIDLFAFETLGATIPTLPANPHSGDIAIDGRVQSDVKTNEYSAELNWEFDGFTFTSITAKTLYDESQDIDADFSSLDLAGRRFIQQEYDSFTQEFRLTSTGDRAVDWIVGGFYYNNKLDFTNNTPYGDQLRPFTDLASRQLFSQSFGQQNVDELFGLFGLGPTAGAPSLLELLVASNAQAGNPLALQLAQQGRGGPLLGGAAYLGDGQGLVEEDYDYDTKSWSVFGQVDVHLTDKATFTVGMRYAEEEKDIDARIDINDPWSALNFADLGQDLRLVSAQTCLNPADYQTCVFFVPFVLAQAGAPFNPLVPLTDAQAANPGINALLALNSTQFNPPSGNFADSREDENLAATAIFSYDWTDRLSTYASYSTGFKPGGFNVSSNATLTGVIEFNEETAESIEVGLKASVLGDTANVNFALFDQTIDGFQSNNFVGGGFALQNAGSITIRGLEFDGVWNPTERLLLTGGFSWLFDSKYDKFVNGPCPDLFSLDDPGPCTPTINTLTGLPTLIQDLSGKDIGTEWTGSLTGTYFQPIGANLEGFLRGEVYYVDDQFLTTSQDPRIVNDSTTLLNASVGLGAKDGGWELQVWGKNLAEEEYFKGGFPSVGLLGTSYNNYPSDPRTYGVTLRVRH